MDLVFFSNPEGLVVPRPSTFSSSPLSCSLGSYSKINLHVSLCLRLCFQGTQAKTALIRITREVLLLPLLHRGGTRRKV